MSQAPEPLSSPFPGLRPYQTGEILYRRGPEHREILEQLYSGRSVLLYGPPRCGKTSLVQAGLIPNLLDQGYTILPTVHLDLPIPANFQNIQPAPNRFLLSLLQSLEAPMRVDAPLSPEAFAEFDLVSYLSGYLERFQSVGPRALRPNPSPDRPAQFVMVVDQLERIFLPLEQNLSMGIKGGGSPSFLPTPEQTALFEDLRRLHARYREQVRFILVLRGEFLELAQTYFTPISILTQWRVELGTLTVEDAAQAINGPLNRRGMAVESGANLPLLDSLRRIRTPEGEQISTSARIDPFQLQIVLQALWERLPHDTQTLSAADIVQAVEVDEALAGYYKDQVRRAAAQGLTVEGELRDWIGKTLIGPDGSLAPVEIPQPGAPKMALELLEEAGILRLDLANLQVAYGLADERWVYPINLDNLRYRPPTGAGEATQAGGVETPLPDQRVAQSNVVYTKEAIKLHSQPGPFSPILTELARGSALSLAPETDLQAALARLDTPGEWLHVRLPDGIEGYIEADLTQRTPPLEKPEPGGATQAGEVESPLPDEQPAQPAKKRSARKAQSAKPDVAALRSATSEAGEDERVAQPNAAWLVIARPEQYNWLEAYRQLARGGPQEVHWTHARGSLAQKHISAARPGDLVLAYSSASAQRAIVGLAEIRSEPGLVDGYPAVFIRLRQPLDQPVSLEELRRNLPGLEKVRQERASFSRVSPAEWHILRQLLLQRNPSLEDRLPTWIGPLEPRLGGLKLELSGPPESAMAGSTLEAALDVTNTTPSLPGPLGESRLLILAEWLPNLPHDEPAPYFSVGLAHSLKTPLDTLSKAVLGGLEIPVPSVPSGYYLRLTAIEDPSLLEGQAPELRIDVTPAETDTLRLDILNLRRELRDWPNVVPPADWTAIDALLGQAQGALARNEREAALGRYMQAQALWLQGKGESLTKSVGATQGDVAAQSAATSGEGKRVAQAAKKRPTGMARSTKPDVAARSAATSGEGERVAPPAQSAATRSEGEQVAPAISLSIVYAQPELAPPPPPENKLVIEIDDNAVELRFKDPESGQELAYRSSALPLKRRPALYQPFDYKPAEYGQLLFKALFNEQADQPAQYESTAAGYRKARPVAHQLAIELVLHSQQNHAYLPWEYLTDESGSPLAALAGSPLYRAWKKPVTPQELARWRIPTRPLRILFVICDPLELRSGAGAPPEIEADLADNPVRLAIAELPSLNAKNLADSLHLALRNLKQAGLVDYTILGEPGGQHGPASFENMRKLLATGRYHVLHLTAHGLLHPAKEYAYALVMEEAGRHFELVSPERFDKRLVQQSGLRLAVLSACNSANIELFFKSQRDLAGRLLSLGLPAVIGMSDRIDELAARILANRFYDDLARLGRIEMALAAARSALYDDKPGQRDWGLPLLWMRPGLEELLVQDLDDLAKLPRPSNAEIRAAAQAEQRHREPPAAPGKLAEQAVRKAFQAYGLALPELALSGLGERLAERVNSPRPEGLPLAEPQKRAELINLAEPLNLRAAELQAYVEQVSQLRLRPELYNHLVASLNAGKHLILIGPHGSAKTTLARALCEFASGKRLPGAAAAPPACHDYRLATATADWTTFDTIGGYMPDQDQSLQFRPGLFLEAIRNAHWLIIDEINRAEIDKAIGPLFTVLSGQGVDLPYRVQRQPVRILPPVENRPAVNPPRNWWIPPGVKDDDFSYVIHPNWRIIGTMNVYDKSSLFQLSFAFMRRFAFIEVELPGDQDYTQLLNDWLKNEYSDLGAELHQAITSLFQRLLWQVTIPVEYTTLFPSNLPTRNPLMERRAIGPAIARDMLAYLAQRLAGATPPAAPAAGPSPAPDPRLGLVPAYFAEACGIYIVPQLDGLEHQAIKDIYTHIAGYILFANPRQAAILKRIEQLYPHIHDWK